jgi:hypothetical protein
VILRNTTPVLGLHRPQFADLVLLAAQCVFIIVLPTNNKDYLESLIIPILLGIQVLSGEARTWQWALWSTQILSKARKTRTKLHNMAF